MRHWLATVVTAVIAAMLIIGASLFAWIRSEQVVLADSGTVLAQHEPAPDQPFEWKELGQKAYRANCMMCHGPAGAGWDQYPALKHAADLFQAEGGREYLINVHLFGLASDRYRAPMPPMAHLRDVELAAVLNHTLTNYGNKLPEDAKLYRPDDIKPLREQKLSSKEVNERRPKLPSAQ